LHRRYTNSVLFAMSTSVSSSDSATETPGYIGLEVPGEPGVFFCARHKSVKVRLRCGRCETPICPKCTMMTPVGARCKNCGSNKSSHMYQVGPQQMGAAFGVSVLLGIVGALIARLPVIGLLTILYAPAAGTLIGQAITRLTKGKRGSKLGVACIAGLAVGALGFAVVASGGMFGLGNIWLWLFLGLAASTAWAWLK
jgi:hypothetical protein